jgi:SAM domain (Sterile alpha motif)
MQDIAHWLKTLGLPEHARSFAENGMDLGFPNLADQDLKDIGVLLGHRRKILAAVAELPGKSPSASRPFPPLVEARDRHTTEPAQPAPVALPPTEATGERRHVTVMFCDLADSTGIAAKLDAEEWRDLVSTYLEAALGLRRVRAISSGAWAARAGLLARPKMPTSRHHQRARGNSVSPVPSWRAEHLGRNGYSLRFG